MLITSCFVCTVIKFLHKSTSVINHSILAVKKPLYMYILGNPEGSQLGRRDIFGGRYFQAKALDVSFRRKNHSQKNIAALRLATPGSRKKEPIKPGHPIGMALVILYSSSEFLHK